MVEHRTERVIEGEARPEWGRLPAVAVALVSVLLAAIVGMTSASSPWVTGDGADPSPPPFVAEALAVALAVGLSILLGVIWIRAPRKSKTTKKPRPSSSATDGIRSGLRTGTLVLIGGLLFSVLLLAFWFLLGQADSVQPPPLITATVRDVPPLPPTTPSPTAPPVFDWFLFGLVASIAVILPLGLIARRRLRVSDESEQEEGDVPASVVRAVGESIDQIERDPDARRAIIRAYARMEHAFDDAGMPRRPSEAPFEYLGRALRGVRVSPPAAGRLATLFERARFSRHVVDVGTKEDAIGELREIERQLEPPPP
jgi:hypothetical protein